jgi:hypothetical protein
LGEAFKAIGAFVAKNWQTLALIAFIVFFFLSKNDYGALKKSMEVMTVSYQEQLENGKTPSKRTKASRRVNCKVRKRNCRSDYENMMKHWRI